MSENIHIPYKQSERPYHKVTSRLVCRYAKKDNTVLDIGCGVGHTLASIYDLRKDLKLYALDIDTKCLELASEKVKLEKTIQVDSIDQLFETTLKYDVVILSHSLEHMYSPVDIVNKIKEVVTDEGLIILVVPNPVRLDVIFSNLIRKNYVNKGHVVAWDRSHWINFLENILKLDVITYAEDYFPLPGSRKIKILAPLEFLLVKLFPWFSFSNIAVIRNHT